MPIEALHRISGNKLIAPDDATKAAIQKAHISRLIGSYQLCLDSTGHAQDIRILEPTGAPSYDQEIVAGLQRWVYEPYLDEGTAIPVCSAITFIYSQR